MTIDDSICKNCLKKNNCHVLLHSDICNELRAIAEHDKEVYNKAIDDFAEKLCEACNDNSTKVYFEGIFCDILTLDNITDLIFMIAEQLKAGEPGES